jgi:F-type H+-transporting ATPase subunit a
VGNEDVASGGGGHSPIEQFALQTLMPLKLFGFDASITNSSAFMLGTVGLICTFLHFATRNANVIPGRLQASAEMLYDFVAGTVRDNLDDGHEGKKFLPFVFALFAFVLVANFLGMIPGFFTVTSHIVITAALALLVISVVLLYGFAKHGMGFLKLFVPSGVPMWLMPLLIPIEIISFVSRPVSLSVRLFANMLAGHIALKIFAGFVGTLLAAGAWKVLSPLPLALTTALTALELLVAFLQAYVFAVLTCVYLSDAVHGAH